MKLIVSLLFFTLFLSAFELDINMGGGTYYTGSSGKLIYKKDFWLDSSGDMDHANEATPYTWVEITTDQEYWPKMRLELNQLKTTGQSLIHMQTDEDTINDVIDWIEENLPGSMNDIYYDSRLTQTNIEAYLFYEYFEDTGFPTFAFGGGVKSFDFDYAVTIIDGLQFNDNGGDTIPLLFFRSRYLFDERPSGSSLAFEASLKVYVFGDSNIYDYLIKTDFLMKYNEDTDVGIEVGYKETYFDIQGDDIDTVGGNMKTAGPYIGLIAHFK